MNLPNRLSIARIGLTGIFVAAMLLPRDGVIMSYFPYGKTLALVVFGIAALTDWLDGWLARRNKLETNFGALLDPVADKVLTAAAFICFIEQQNYKGQSLVQGWMVLIIVARDFLVTGLRLVASSNGVVVKAEQLGKHKTISQMSTIIVVLVGLAARDDWGLWGTSFDVTYSRIVLGMMIATVTLTVWSGGGYFWRNRDIFNDG